MVGPSIQTGKAAGDLWSEMHAHRLALAVAGRRRERLEVGTDGDRMYRCEFAFRRRKDAGFDRQDRVGSAGGEKAGVELVDGTLGVVEALKDRDHLGLQLRKPV